VQDFFGGRQRGLGDQAQVMDRFHGIPQAVDALDEVVRSRQKPLDHDEANALKKLRKRWLKSAAPRNVDALIARYEWRRRFPALRATLNWGQALRTWFERK
jgi:transposase